MMIEAASAPRGDDTIPGDFVSRALGSGYLGDPSVTMAVTRLMIGEAIEGRAKAIRGEIASRQLFAANMQAIERAAGIFSMRAPGYTAMPGWNPAGLAAMLRAEENIQDDDDIDVIRAALAGALADVYELADGYEQDRLSLDDYRDGAAGIATELGQQMAGIPRPVREATKDA